LNAIIKNYNNAPQVFPMPWADEWGQDQYGAWMMFKYKDVEQRMRWIKPGKFMMGSPVEEKERGSNETQHEVILTEGFWMADTTCTQELWEAVMGDNPANFKGPQRPVEQVSWEDCKTFMDKINQLIPGLELCLPTEAQWEYACRAGTESPFSFGKNITTEQVNYDGNYPYGDGKKGKYREETVDVKLLPCNAWGLYQMHGNVWEWCEDWFGDYSTKSILDPKGPDSGGYRVLRGGSWDFNGWSVRSALRDRYVPSYRYHDVGFRFSQVIKGSGGAVKKS